MEYCLFGKEEECVIKFKGKKKVRREKVRKRKSKWGNTKEHMKIEFERCEFNDSMNDWGIFTGKTYVWKTLFATVQSKGDIVLNVTSNSRISLYLCCCWWKACTFRLYYSHQSK